jgi:hypothetical protein
MGDSLLHDTGALYDLRKEHLTRTKQVTNYVHSIHEGAFDDVNGAVCKLAGFLDIFNNELVDTLHQRVGKALVDWQFSPLDVHYALF